ncbi:MAG: hypothetical protein J6I66_01870 [Lachnospiraceae bacterium]|nr:hypothetical protein [Lachnospiraceae bacterium]
MKTKYNIGDEVYFKGIINDIHITPSGSVIYKMKGHDNVVFSEEELIKTDTPIVKRAYVGLIPDTSEVDEAMEKAERITDLINEAMKLADSIANTKLNIRISSEFDGNATELACITTE